MGRPYTASGTIIRARFVKVSGVNTVAAAGAGEQITGISQLGSRTAPIPSVTADPPEAAQSGEQVNVLDGVDGFAMLEIGTGGCTAGNLLKAESGGKGIALALSGKEHYGAEALETCSAGELCRVKIKPGVSYT